MRQLIVKQLDYDLTPVAGLVLVGHYLAALQPVLARLDAALPVKSGVTNSDIVRSYVGLLVQGKSDFDAIENFRGDTFYKQSLGIRLLPSSPTLRQRMDARAGEMFDFAVPMIETLLAGQRPDYGVLPCGWLPLDVDTFATQGCRGPLPLLRQRWHRQGRRGPPYWGRGPFRGPCGRGRILPAGSLSGQPRLLPGAGTASGRAALRMGHERGPYP